MARPKKNTEAAPAAKKRGRKPKTEAAPAEKKTTPKNLRDVGRFHQLAWGGGQITVPKELVQYLPFENTDKLMIEYEKGELIVTKLNE